jgi:hypothetical protein
MHDVRMIVMMMSLTGVENSPTAKAEMAVAAIPMTRMA